MTKTKEHLNDWDNCTRIAEDFKPIKEFNLSKKINSEDIDPFSDFLFIEDVKEFIKEEDKSQEQIIAFETLIDDYFPKGDKRRGDVLVILADLNVKLIQNRNRLAGDKL